MAKENRFELIASSREIDLEVDTKPTNVLHIEELRIFMVI